MSAIGAGLGLWIGAAAAEGAPPSAAPQTLMPVHRLGEAGLLLSVAGPALRLSGLLLDSDALATSGQATMYAGVPITLLGGIWSASLVDEPTWSGWAAAGSYGAYVGTHVQRRRAGGPVSQANTIASVGTYSGALLGALWQLWLSEEHVKLAATGSGVMLTGRF